jgi:small subunit ribosomal protein S16
MKDPSEIKLNGEKVKHWLQRGAQPTDKAKKLIQKAGL